MKKINLKQTFAIFLAVVMFSTLFVACNNDEDDDVKKTKIEVKSYPNIDKINFKSIKINMALTLVSEFYNDTKLVLFNNNTGGIDYKKFISDKDDLGKPDFWSGDRDEFYRWVDENLAKGYEVVITYDRETGAYFGWIIKK
ncbi:MAG: hypothetical protein IJ213_08320 [Bacteroidales bacterium]|nr:hypothetical protein [Bacteroidales bacterium]